MPGPFTWQGLAAALVAAAVVGGAILVAYRLHAVPDLTMTVRIQPRNVAPGERFTVIVEPGGEWVCGSPTFSLGTMGGQAMEFVAVRGPAATRTQHIVPETARLGEFLVRVECMNGERSGTGEARGMVARKSPPVTASPAP